MSSDNSARDTNLKPSGNQNVVDSSEREGQSSHVADNATPTVAQDSLTHSAVKNMGDTDLRDDNRNGESEDWEKSSSGYESSEDDESWRWTEAPRAKITGQQATKSAIAPKKTDEEKQKERTAKTKAGEGSATPEKSTPKK